MSKHPTPDTLKNFLLGRLSAEGVKKVTRHLLSGCSRCKESIRPLSAAMFRPGRAEGIPLPEQTIYEHAVQSACEAVLERERLLKRERAEAPAKVIRLLILGGSEKDQKLTQQPGFWTWALCEALLEKSWSLRHDDPKGMLHLSELAAEAAQRLDSSAYGEESVADLQARAWIGLANALRVSDQLPLAQEVLRRAFEARKKGTGSPLLRARIAELSASLMCDLRHFPTAFRLLDLAITLYLRAGLNHEAGCALIQKGVHTGRSGDPEHAIFLLAQGLRFIDRERDPKLPFHALHNILLFRIELGQYRTARIQLWEMRPLYERHADKINLLRLRWLEGRIFVGLGDFERADRALLQAKERYEQAGMIYDSALISFDLASVWLQKGKRKEVRQLIQEMLDTFRARYIAREAIASLLMLRDAADRGILSLDLLDMVAGFFRSLKDEPKAQDPGEMH